jgi:hypothetical protein
VLRLFEACQKLGISLQIEVSRPVFSRPRNLQRSIIPPELNGKIGIHADYLGWNFVRNRTTWYSAQRPS